MSDVNTRGLERAVAAGDEDAMERLKREWLRTQIYRSCPTCNADVPDGVWEEHLAECAPPSSRMRVVQVPSTGIIGARPRKNPLYDRIVLEGPNGASRNRFFAGENKPIWESNMSGTALPANTHFYWYGLSLIPDARAHPDDIALIYDTGHLTMTFGSTRLLELPGRILMEDQPTIATQDGEEEQQRFAWEARTVLDPDPRVTRLRNDGPVRKVTISERPIEINAMEEVRFDLNVESGIQRSTGIMLVLFGILLRDHGLKTAHETRSSYERARLRP